jgi:phosphate transport system protein
MGIDHEGIIKVKKVLKSTLVQGSDERMTEKFHLQLEELKKDVVAMGSLAKDMLKKSVEALKDRDVDKAQWVVTKKHDIAKFDADIEMKALQLLTLYQPMASDLRTIACVLKLITYLNRVGRYGKDIAQVALELSNRPHITKLVSLPYMAELANGMIDDALKAFEQSKDLSLKEYKERDSAVDSLRFSIFRECLTYMMEDAKTIPKCANYMMVSRYLERCADHAVKMAEKIHYMATGEHVEVN